MNEMNRGAKGFSRRDALKTLGTGAAVVGLGMISGRALAASATVPSAPPAGAGVDVQPFSVPKLNYDFSALEPYIDARTMEIHLTKHHQAYVTNANKALADYPDLQKRSAEYILKNLGTVPDNIRVAVRNNVGGHVNHTFFWNVIGPHQGGVPGEEMSGALAKAFGSVDTFKAQFADAAMKRFGSGWAWLTLKDGTLSVQSTANQDSPLTDGATPLLGIDVWEHAYYLHYQNRRADYVAAFWNVVNWHQVEANYGASLKT